MRIRFGDRWLPARALAARLLLGGLVASSLSCGGESTSPQPPSTPVTPKVDVPATIALTASTSTISVGRTTQLTAQVRNASGMLLPAQVSFSSSAANIAEVDASGRVTGRGAGTAIMTAAVAGVQATTPVVVLPTLTLYASTSPTSLDTVLALRGTGLSGAQFKIDGASVVATAASTDTIAVLRLPPPLLVDCIAAGRRLSVSAVNAAADSATTTVPLAAKALVLSLPREGSVVHVDSSRAGCPVTLSPGMSYLLLPYNREGRGGVFQNATDSVAIELAVTPVGVAAAQVPLVRSSSTTASIPDRRLTSDTWQGRRVSLDADLRLSAGLRIATTAAPCVLPQQVGDSVLSRTVRDLNGEFLSWGYEGTAPNTRIQVESWTVVARSAHGLFVIDSSLVRLRNTSAQARSDLALAIDSTVRTFENEAVPFYTRWLAQLPDDDANGRVVFFMTRFAPTSPGGLAGPWMAGIVGCTAGESIALNLRNAAGGNAAVSIPNKSLVLHEVGHIFDLGGRAGLAPSFAFNAGSHLAMFIEGSASFFEAVMQQGRSEDVIVANATKYGAYDGASRFCVVPRPDVLSGPESTGRSYALGCYVVSYLMQRRMQERGGTLGDAILRWRARPDSARSFAWAAAWLQIPNSEHVLPEMLASWYADDYVATDPALQIGMWNTRAVTQSAKYAPYFVSAPDAVLSPLGARFVATLGAPDGRYVEITPAAPLLASLTTSKAAFLGTRTGLLIMRIR